MLHQICALSALTAHVWPHRDYTLHAGRSVFVYGKVEELGSWQESRAVQLREVDTPVWEADITIPCTSFPFSYRSSSLLFAFSFLSCLGRCITVLPVLPSHRRTPR